MTSMSSNFGGGGERPDPANAALLIEFLNAIRHCHGVPLCRALTSQAREYFGRPLPAYSPPIDDDDWERSEEWAAPLSGRCHECGWCDLALT